MNESSGPRESWSYHWKTRLNPDGTREIIELSEGLAQLYGYEPEELLQPEAWRLLIPHDELPVLEEVVDEVWSGEASAWRGRMRIRRKDGTELVVEIETELDDEMDGLTVTKGRLRDVTHEAGLESRLTEHEARLQVLNERLRLILWSCDPELRFTWMWGSGLRLIGLEDNEVVGMTLSEYFDTDDPGFEPIAAERRALTGQHVSYEMEWRDRHLRCTVEPHVGPLGEVVGTIGTAIDVTEEHMLERESRELISQVGSQRPSVETAWRPPTPETILEVGPLWIDVEGFEVRKHGAKIELTPTEFRLLVELASRAGRVFHREVLLRSVWGHTFLGGGSLMTMAVRRLRSKVEDDPSSPTLIETVRGVGYRMRSEDDA